jgi:hypothetical protein
MNNNSFKLNNKNTIKNELHNKTINMYKYLQQQQNNNNKVFNPK